MAPLIKEVEGGLIPNILVKESLANHNLCLWQLEEF